MSIFRIYVDGQLFYHPHLSKLAITQAQVQEDAENIDSLTLSAPFNHPYLGVIKPMASAIVCKKGDDIVFEGRALDDGSDFYNTHTWTCESCLAYLKDTLQPPYAYQGTLKGLLELFLAGHNESVEEKKQFTLGKVTVTDPNDYIAYSNSDYSATMDAIKDKLLDTHGGYLSVRHEGDVRYLDYLADFTEQSAQTVAFGKNLTDVTITRDHADRVTALIPFGAKKTEEDEEGNVTELDGRIDITDVNHGVNYVYDEDAVKEIGWVWATEVWEDVTKPLNLLKKAKARVAELAQGITGMELSIVDESSTEAGIGDIRARAYVRCISEPHGIDGTYLCLSRTRDYLDPSGNTITIGAAGVRLTTAAARQNQSIDTLVRNAENARLASVTADTYVFKYDKDAALVGASKATLAAKVQGAGIAKWQYKNSSGAWADYPTMADNAAITGDILIVKPAHGVFTENVAQIKLVTDDPAVYDTVSITKMYDGAPGSPGSSGTGGLSVILGNEAQAIACTPDGLVATAMEIAIPFTGYVGITQTPCTCTAGSLPSGMAVKKNTAATESMPGSVVLAIAANAALGGAEVLNGSVSLTFALSGASVTKQFSWSKSNRGATGADGAKGDTGMGYKANLLTGTADSKTIIGADKANQCVVIGNLECGHINNLPEGKYTVSADITCDVGGGTFLLQWGGLPWGLGKGGKALTNGTSHFTWTWTVAHDDAYGAKNMQIRLDNVPTTSTVTVSNLMLVAGEEEAEWGYATSELVGEKGDRGDNAIAFSVYAPEGTVVMNQSGSLPLVAAGYDGAAEIGTGGTYQWARYTGGQWADVAGAASPKLTVSGTDILNIQSYRCAMAYKGKSYVDVITVEDKSDPYVSEMLAIGGYTVKDNLGGVVPYVIVRTNQKEVDPLLGGISETAPSAPKSGDFWYKVDHTAKNVSLMKYSGSAWAAATEGQSLTYTWYAQDADGQGMAFGKTGKVVYLSAADIDSIMTLQCDVSN